MWTKLREKVFWAIWAVFAPRFPGLTASLAKKPNLGCLIKVKCLTNLLIFGEKALPWKEEARWRRIF